MADRRATALTDVDEQVRDAGDVLLVLGAVLNAETSPLSASLRDALATVARLGQCRIDAARTSLDEAQGGARG